jgi:hypothetical protein
MSMAWIFLSGIFFGILYKVMDVTQIALESTNCVIENNTLVASCQELWNMSIYPFLALKDMLIWFSFFFIFALVFSMLITGYKSGKSPWMMGLLVTYVAVLTYFGIELSNMYRTMLSNEVFRFMMVDFTVYNKIMLNFPWFCFFIGLFSIMLALVNYQKSNNNKDRGENDY